MPKKSKKSIVVKPGRLRQLIDSVWLFPVLLVIPLLLLTALRISGSSLGYYHDFFYGETKSDSNLILNKPRPIRSDEWLVNTQLTIAQDANGLDVINENQGNGQDASVIGEAPHNGWSTIFKPHMWSFLILPLEYAFAFRWWALGFFLVTSVYFLTLKLLPKKRLMASLISTAIFFSPFVQWWYLAGTISSIYAAIWAVLAVIYLFEQKSRKKSIIATVLLAYATASFALLLYPPFQIAVAVVLGFFLLGYLIEKFQGMDRKFIVSRLGYITAAMAGAGAVVAAFIVSRSEVIETLQNTAYPGNRVTSTGGFDLAHTLSGHFAPIFQFTGRAARYMTQPGDILNQSASSNFILLVPYLFIPSIIMLFVHYRKKKQIDWPLLSSVVIFALLMIRMFGPVSLSAPFKLLLLDNVPHRRLLIGLGVLSFVHLALFIRHQIKFRTHTFSKAWAYTYSALLFAWFIWLGMLARERSLAMFIDYWMVFVLAIPIPVVVMLILRKRFEAGLLVFLAFSVISTAGINPLYRGLGAITETKISQSIRELSGDDDVWVSESIFFENFPAVNGARGLSGTYLYPQLELWEPIDNGEEQDEYNRYAHMTFGFDRDPETVLETDVKLVGTDHVRIATEPCSDFLKESGVTFLITVAELDENSTCATLAQKVEYPQNSLFIYQVVF